MEVWKKTLITLYETTNEENFVCFMEVWKKKNPNHTMKPLRYEKKKNLITLYETAKRFNSVIRFFFFTPPWNKKNSLHSLNESQVFCYKAFNHKNKLELSLNPSPNDKILDQSTLKPVAENKWYKNFLKEEKKHCGKSRKYWLPVFSPFNIFSKGLSLWVVKNRDCVIKN